MSETALDTVLEAYRDMFSVTERGNRLHRDACVEVWKLRENTARIAELEAYVSDVKEWFDNFGEHAPIQFGGEDVMSDRAAALLRKD